MKISLVPGKRDALTPETAKGCVAMNLALPGFGSLMAGRAVGYAQALLTLTGFFLTMILGVKFLIWSIANWSELQSPEADPIATLAAIARGVRWPLFGIAMFGVAWVWALATNASILDASRQPAAKPPKLNPS